jgi:hypothetical protein
LVQSRVLEPDELLNTGESEEEEQIECSEG